MTYFKNRRNFSKDKILTEKIVLFPMNIHIYSFSIKCIGFVLNIYCWKSTWLIEKTIRNENEPAHKNNNNKGRIKYCNNELERLLKTSSNPKYNVFV